MQAMAAAGDALHDLGADPTAQLSGSLKNVGSSCTHGYRASFLSVLFLNDSSGARPRALTSPGEESCDSPTLRLGPGLQRPEDHPWRPQQLCLGFAPAVLPFRSL